MSARSPFDAVVAALGKKRGATVGAGWGEDNLTVKRAGKICAMQVRGALVVKLPRARVDALVDERVGTRFDPRKNGRVMKEWLVVQPGAADWVELALEAYAYAAAAKKR